MKKYLLVAAQLFSLLAITGTAIAEPAASAPAGPVVEFVDPLAMSSRMQSGVDLSPLSMYLAADGVVKAVIQLLIVASVITWAIGLAKWLEIRRERRSLKEALHKLRGVTSVASASDIDYAPLADMIFNTEDEIAVSQRGRLRLQADGVKERISIRLERIEEAVKRRAGRGVGVLAIVSSTAPFVGLAGTVWGIMNSFIGIAHSHTTNLAVVAPGIAEALLTTAIGLAAAIPAAILYNVFARILSNFAGELTDASFAVLLLAAREVDGTAAGRDDR